MRGFLHSSVSKESACNARDLGLIPGSGRAPGEGDSNPLQYSCLENPTDRGAWRATVHGVAESNRTEHASIISALKGFLTPGPLYLLLSAWGHLPQPPSHSQILAQTFPLRKAVINHLAQQPPNYSKNYSGTIQIWLLW